MRLTGANPTARFFETLMDEICHLRFENQFLGNQIALNHQLPGQELTKRVEAEDSRLARHEARRTRRNESYDYDDYRMTEVRHRGRSRSQSSSEATDSVQNSDMSDSSTFPREDALLTDSSTTAHSRHYQILHGIRCLSRRHDHAFRTLPPTVPLVMERKSSSSRRRRVHLQDEGTIVNPEILHRKRSPISFFVLRIYTCPDADNLQESTYRKKTQTLKLESDEECLAYMSSFLLEGLQNCARCEFEERDTLISLSVPKLLSPYCFIYQHRSRLDAYARGNTGAMQQDVSNLLEYFQAAFGESYNVADDLVARGMTSNAHFWKLFQPNSLILLKETNQVYVLSSWPQLRGDHLALKCWSWAYDGTGVFRQTTSLEVTCEGSEPKLITDLDCYPIQFADTANQELIRNRGRKFWDLKDPGLVSYTGRNGDDTDDHVSLIFALY
jgi:hypothetical protein